MTTMTLDPDRPDLCLGVIGAGAMGRGIVQVAATAGIRVLISDAQDGAAEKAVAFIAGMLDRLVDKGRVSAADAKATKDRIEIVHGGLMPFAECQVIVEAIVENLEVKRELFSGLEEFVDDDCVLATNTSSLSVTAIAAGCRRPNRVAGFHFFNPVPLMKVVEVIGCELTDPWVTDALAGIARRMGHHPAVTIDMPGFLVNHAGRGFGTEALRIVGEGISDFPGIDRVLRDVAGFRMGPFELMDLTGLDVSHTVMESIYDQFYQEPRFRPSPITRRRVMAGLYGRKSGRGYYDYADGKMVSPPEQNVPEATSLPVWVSPAEPEAQAALTKVLRDAGAEVREGADPPVKAVLFVTPFGTDATTTTVKQGLDAARTVAVDALFGLDRRRTLMTTPVTDAAVRDTAHALLAGDGTPVTVIHDSPGFIAQRVVATIVNIGCDIAQQRIARPADIDTAVRLGLGYPHGPLGFGDAVGPRRVLAILEAMERFYGDPRYRPSPWLRRRALLGVSLTTPED
jgi:3-hydroxybutyryl-CoA dehydrogenase